MPIMKGTQAAYDAIEIKNPDVIYIINDTGAMYLGAIPIGISASKGSKAVKNVTLTEGTADLVLTHMDGSTQSINLTAILPESVAVIDGETPDAKLPTVGALKSYTLSSINTVREEVLESTSDSLAESMKIGAF